MLTDLLQFVDIVGKQFQKERVPIQAATLVNNKVNELAQAATNIDKGELDEEGKRLFVTDLKALLLN